MSEMMVTEAMKRLRLIEKKMTNNAASIQRYASMVSTEKPYFDNEDKQKSEIKSLIQSNQDLVEEYLKLKQQIEYTNLFTLVEMGGRKYSISELLVIKRRLAQKMLHTFNSLNRTEGDSRLNSYRMQNASTGQTPHVVRYYREEDKNEGLKVWQDLYDNIESRLEVINATAPLMSLPQPQ